MKEKAADKIHEAFVEVLIDARKKQKLSHEKLAALAGFHRTAISHIENRRTHPTLFTCLKLAEALGRPLSEMIAAAEKASATKRRGG